MYLPCYHLILSIKFWISVLTLYMMSQDSEVLVWACWHSSSDNAYCIQCWAQSLSGLMWLLNPLFRCSFKVSIFPLSSDVLISGSLKFDTILFKVSMPSRPSLTKLSKLWRDWSWEAWCLDNCVKSCPGWRNKGILLAVVFICCNNTRSNQF